MHSVYTLALLLKHSFCLVCSNESNPPPPQLIELFSQLGVDGLLVEYEDMFPYEGELKLLQATAQPAYRCSKVVNIRCLNQSFLYFLCALSCSEIL